MCGFCCVFIRRLVCTVYDGLTKIIMNIGEKREQDLQLLPFSKEREIRPTENRNSVYMGITGGNNEYEIFRAGEPIRSRLQYSNEIVGICVYISITWYYLSIGGFLE